VIISLFSLIKFFGIGFLVKFISVGITFFTITNLFVLGVTKNLVHSSMLHVCEHVILMSLVFLQKNHVYFALDFLFINMVRNLSSCLGKRLKEM
jgi:hypothetical protein